MTHKPTVFLLSDSLASVNDAWTMTMGKIRPWTVVIGGAAPAPPG